jgi:hypothetical protein
MGSFSLQGRQIHARSQERARHPGKSSTPVYVTLLRRLGRRDQRDEALARRRCASSLAISQLDRHAGRPLSTWTAPWLPFEMSELSTHAARLLIGNSRTRPDGSRRAEQHVGKPAVKVIRSVQVEVFTGSGVVESDNVLKKSTSPRLPPNCATSAAAPVNHP